MPTHLPLCHGRGGIPIRGHVSRRFQVVDHVTRLGTEGVDVSHRGTRIYRLGGRDSRQPLGPGAGCAVTDPHVIAGQTGASVGALPSHREWRRGEQRRRGRRGWRRRVDIERSQVCGGVGPVACVVHRSDVEVPQPVGQGEAREAGRGLVQRLGWAGYARGRVVPCHGIAANARTGVARAGPGHIHCVIARPSTDHMAGTAQAGRIGGRCHVQVETHHIHRRPPRVQPQLSIMIIAPALHTSRRGQGARM